MDKTDQKILFGMVNERIRVEIFALNEIQKIISKEKINEGLKITDFKFVKNSLKMISVEISQLEKTLNVVDC